jgi:hypothetical protein
VLFNQQISSVVMKRPELARCLEFVRDGDTLVVTKLDRLARSSRRGPYLFGANVPGLDSLTAERPCAPSRS